jgi:hypothetical protein
MTASPSAQDVADALAMTLEREDGAGAPWCPPGDGAALRRWVTDRSASLGTGIRRAVRLARLMAVADGRDYTRFLYQRVGSLRARHFRHGLERAAAEGRLPKSVATLSERGVHLREAAIAPQGTAHEGFEIDFAQMPRLAALIDILHNALGFTVVADLFAPLLAPGAPRTTADDVARPLQAAFNAWLGERLESANHLLQAQQIRTFLMSRGRLVPEAVDDEAILLFWTMAAQARNERMDGFRLYRSVAAALLRYRQALRDAAVARHLEDAIRRGFEPDNDNMPDAPAETGGETWRSPLRALVAPPASRVKWLTGREQHALANYLGGAGETGEEDDPDRSGEEDGGDSAWKGGLAGEERFDLAFWLTLLRADVFGAIQASIVARLRKRAAANAAIAEAMAPLDNASYRMAATAYADLRDQLRIESLAALALLMDVGAAEAVILLDRLAGRAGVGVILGDAATKQAWGGEDEGSAVSLTAEIAPALKAAIADVASVPEGASRKLLLDALAARRKVSRAGFRREDSADPEMLAALRCGAAAVFDVIAELDRLTATLSQKAATADCAGDTARFQTVFRDIYLGSVEA